MTRGIIPPMPQPPTYTRQFDFTDFSTAHPNSQQPGQHLDAEYNAIRATLLAILVNLSLIQRDDGRLANSAVHLDALNSGVRALIAATSGNPRGAWVTATDYELKDVVVESGVTYICCVPHTSGVFADDLADVKWLRIGATSTAGDILFTPAGDISATTVQAAVEEVANERQPLHAILTSLAGVSLAADKLPYGSGSNTFSLTDLTAAGRALLACEDADAQLDALGFSAFVKSLVDASNYAALLTDIGVSSFMQTVLDDADADAARNTLGAEKKGEQLINTQTDNYTLALTDKGKIVEGFKATGMSIEVPPNASVAFPIGTIIDLCQMGAGQVTIVAGSGVTIRSSDGKLKLRGQYSTATLYKRGTDEWVLCGDLAA